MTNYISLLLSRAQPLEKSFAANFCVSRNPWKLIEQLSFIIYWGFRWQYKIIIKKARERESENFSKYEIQNALPFFDEAFFSCWFHSLHLQNIIRNSLNILNKRKLYELNWQIISIALRNVLDVDDSTNISVFSFYFYVSMFTLFGSRILCLLPSPSIIFALQRHEIYWMESFDLMMWFSARSHSAALCILSMYWYMNLYVRVRATAQFGYRRSQVS